MKKTTYSIFKEEYRNNLMDILIMSSGIFILLKMTDIYKTLASMFLINTINYIIYLYDSCKNKDNRNIFKYGVFSIMTLIVSIFIYTNY